MLIHSNGRKAPYHNEDDIFDEQKFDPEGSGYDYKTAKKGGYKPDASGHWASRDIKTGQILKGRKHPTYHKTVEGEKKAGYIIFKGKGGRYFSRPIDRRER